MDQRGSLRRFASRLVVMVTLVAASVGCGSDDGATRDAGEPAVAATEAGEPAAADTDAGEVGAADTDSTEEADSDTSNDGDAEAAEAAGSATVAVSDQTLEFDVLACLGEQEIPELGLTRVLSVDAVPMSTPEDLRGPWLEIAEAGGAYAVDMETLLEAARPVLEHGPVLTAVRTTDDGESVEDIVTVTFADGTVWLSDEIGQLLTVDEAGGGTKVTGTFDMSSRREFDENFEPVPEPDQPEALGEVSLDATCP